MRNKSKKLISTCIALLSLSLSFEAITKISFESIALASAAAETDFDTAAAVGIPNNWVVEKHNLSGGDDSYAKLVEIETGNYAMHLNADFARADNVYYLFTNVDDGGNTKKHVFPGSGGTYTLSFDAKGITTDTFAYGAYWEGHVIRNSQSSEWIKTELGDGWVNYRFTQNWGTGSDGRELQPAINVDNPVDFIVDNVSFRNDVTGAEYIINGDFSDVTLFDDDEEAVTDFDTAVSVGTVKNWDLEKHNLNEADDSYAKLVETEGGNHAMHLNADFAQADNVYYLFTNVDDNGNTVKHVFPGSGGTYTLSFDAKGITTDTFAYGAYWEGHVIRNSQSSEWIKTELGDGWVNYRFTQNWGTGSDGRELQPAINVDKPVDFIVDNVSFKNDVTGVEYIINGGFEDFTVHSEEEEPSDVVFENAVSVGTPADWTFSKQNMSDADDAYMKLVAVDEDNYAMHLNFDGVETPEVYYRLLNGEGIIFPSGKSWTFSFDLKGSISDNNAVIMMCYWNWSTAENLGSYTKTPLGGGWTNYTCEITGWAGSEGSILIPGVTVQADADFIIDNISIKDSDGKEYILNGDFEKLAGIDYEYMIKVPKLYKNNGLVTEINGSGTYSVKAQVIDYKISDMPVTLGIAVYKDNILQKFMKKEYIFQPNSGGTEEYITADFEIGSGTGYTAEIFIWDSVNTLNILRKCSSFSETAE